MTNVKTALDNNYEVWALGYDENYNITDAEMLIKTFADAEEAITFAKQLTLSDIIYQAAEESVTRYSSNVAYINIEVETVVDGVNIETVYTKHFWLSENSVCDMELKRA